MDAGPGNLKNFQMSPSIKTEEISIHEDCLHPDIFSAAREGDSRDRRTVGSVLREEKSRLVFIKGFPQQG